MQLRQQPLVGSLDTAAVQQRRIGRQFARAWADRGHLGPALRFPKLFSGPPGAGEAVSRCGGAANRRPKFLSGVSNHRHDAQASNTVTATPATRGQIRVDDGS